MLHVGGSKCRLRDDTTVAAGHSFVHINNGTESVCVCPRASYGNSNLVRAQCTVSDQSRSTGIYQCSISLVVSYLIKHVL